MDEPGELQLVVRVDGHVAFYEARWFNDWASWNMHPESEYKVVISGQSSITRIVQQIATVLWDILQNIGPEEYKKPKIKDIHIFDSPILQRLNINANDWLDYVKQFGFSYGHAVGSKEKLKKFAERVSEGLTSRYWCRRVSRSERVYLV